MGPITSAGLGSGLDIEGLVKKLMAVEQRPLSLLQQKSSVENTKLSSWGQIKSALASLETAARALDARSDFKAFTSSIADTSIASLSVGTNAVAGKYSLEVTQLADAQKTRSIGYATANSPLSADTLPATLTLELGSTVAGVFTADGSKTKTISLNSSNNSLSGLRDAINAAKAGVTASIVNDGSATTPYHLVLTADNTGSNNTFKLSGLSDFNFNPATTTGAGLSKVNNGLDATANIDGIPVTSHSNVINEAIQGVTLTLTKTNKDNPTQLSISQDNSAIQTKVKSFVDAYNNLNSLIRQKTAYDKETNSKGDLVGDSLLRSIQDKLEKIMGSSVGEGSVNRLLAIGIQHHVSDSFKVNGSLVFDSAKLNAALNDPAKDVAALFVNDSSTGLKGIASQLASTIAPMLSEGGGLVTDREKTIKASIKSLGARYESVSYRMTQIETRYRNQFNAMDKMISGLNNTSAFLTQQLNSLNNSGKQ